VSRLRRILHPSDFSRASAGAFARALEMAKRDGAELLIVHVRSSMVPLGGDGYMSAKAYEEIEASARAHARKELDRLVARARKAGVRTVGLLLEGVAHERIVAAARSRRAGLIVMGTHGRTGLKKVLLGSVAGRVVSLAACPVLTVRGK
jgi:nucleotide-binding universal stress UspA family protein